MKLSLLINIRERFANQDLYASKSFSAVISKPGETREL